MLRREEWVDIVAAYNRGVSIREISRQSGLSRNTIRKAIRSDKPPEYSQRTPSKLDPYKDYLLKRLEEFPGLSAEKLFSEIKALGYSRMLYAEITTDEKQDTFIACHENAFAYFGGMTKEILYDNAKTVALKHDRDGIVFTPALLDFAFASGLKPRVCRPARPQTKGKVERLCVKEHRRSISPFKSPSPVASSTNWQSVATSKGTRTPSFWGLQGPARPILR